MEEVVINIKEYISKHKLQFRAETLIQFILNFNDFTHNMVQKVALKKTIDTSDCKYCKEIQDKTGSKNSFCKKHKAIYDWKKVNVNKTGVGIFNGYKIQLFGNYALVEMPTDKNGVYVIYIASNREKDSNFVYCLNKEYFDGVFDVGYNIDNLLDTNTILINKDMQLYWDGGLARFEKFL